VPESDGQCRHTDVRHPLPVLEQDRVIKAPVRRGPVLHGHEAFGNFVIDGTAPAPHHDTATATHLREF
jgi:hypothetical protein